MVWNLNSIASPLIVLPPRHVRHGECSHGQGPSPRGPGRPWEGHAGSCPAMFTSRARPNGSLSDPQAIIRRFPQTEHKLDLGTVTQ